MDKALFEARLEAYRAECGIFREEMSELCRRADRTLDAERLKPARDLLDALLGEDLDPDQKSLVGGHLGGLDSTAVALRVLRVAVVALISPEDMTVMRTDVRGKLEAMGLGDDWIDLVDQSPIFQNLGAQLAAITAYRDTIPDKVPGTRGL